MSHIQLCVSSTWTTKSARCMMSCHVISSSNIQGVQLFSFGFYFCTVHRVHRNSLRVSMLRCHNIWKTRLFCNINQFVLTLRLNDVVDGLGWPWWGWWGIVRFVAISRSGNQNESKETCKLKQWFDSWMVWGMERRRLWVLEHSDIKLYKRNHLDAEANALGPGPWS